jgi:hypothetical protein
MSESQGYSAPDATSPEYRAGWAAESASQATTLVGEDLDDDELGMFASRLLGWLRSQPDVISAEIVMDTGKDDRKTSADIILGVDVAAIGGVSMTMNITP